MGIRLKPTKSVSRDVRRIIRRQIDRALDELTSSKTDASIHSIRKRFKRIRSALRLIRDELGRAVYQRENRCFRDAAGPLAGSRDATVLPEALDKLMHHFPGRIPPDRCRGLYLILAENRRMIWNNILGNRDGFPAITRLIEAARGRLSHWSLGHNGRSSLCHGLQRVFNRGYAAFVAAAADPAPEPLHEWRKQAKYFLNQLNLVKKIWPGGIEEVGEQFEELCRLLGDERDLNLLRRKVKDDPARFGCDPVIDAVIRLIDLRSSDLIELSFRLGRSAYRDGPKYLTKRIQTRCFRVKTK